MLIAAMGTAGAWMPGRVYAVADVKPLTPPEQQTLATQVALDRAGFSPGTIDAQLGENTDKALGAFQAARGLPVVMRLDEATTSALADAMHTPLVAYTVTAGDLAHPFATDIPGDMMEQSKLPALTYRSVAELVAERFHTTPALLDRLNPGLRWEEGASLQVPNVEPLFVPEQRGRRKDSPMEAATSIVVVSASSRTLTIKDASDTVRFYAPVSVGSERDPLPTGEFAVTNVVFNPAFFYNPALFWDADPSHARAKLAAGPNNPVGFLWIDLNREHLGIHGTPEPTAVGKSQSHGCIRLTNWDALRVANLIGDGTRVVLQ